MDEGWKSDWRNWGNWRDIVGIAGDKNIRRGGDRPRPPTLTSADENTEGAANERIWAQIGHENFYRTCHGPALGAQQSG